MSEKPPFNLVESFTLAPGLVPPAPPAVEPAPATPRGDRWRTIGHWLRDTGLGVVGFLIVLVVAVSGWTASFIGLHSFGMTHMGLNVDTAWLVPATFDGAPLGLSLVVFRASIHGRSATVWRVLIIVFTLLSSWINWQHIGDPTGRWIASFMPPAAVILFEGLMSEARAAAARRDGQERPRLHPLRWLIDRKGTWAIYRAYVLGIELPDALKEAAKSAKEPAARTSAPVAKSGGQEGGQRPGQEAGQEAAPAVGQEGGQETGQDGPDGKQATGGQEPRATRRRTMGNRPARKPVRSAAKKRRSMDEWVAIGTPVFHAEFARLRRNPSGTEFAKALGEAGHGRPSASTAKNIKTEILDRAPLPSLDGEN